MQYKEELINVANSFWETKRSNKEDITGYIFEPWHLRYVGKALAKELYKNNLTLEEYVRVNKKGGLKSTLC